MERHPLHNKYPQLHKSKEVEHAARRHGKREDRRIEKPSEKLDAYLADLEQIHIGKRGAEGELTPSDPSKKDRIKTALHRQAIIKPENVGDGYIKGVILGNFAEMKGYNRGKLDDAKTKEYIISLFEKEYNVNFDQYDVPDKMRQEVRQATVKDQETSFDAWYDYLASPEAANYPMVFKYWVFESLKKLGSYDSKKKSYSPRTETTVAPYPFLSQQALALVLDEVVRKHHGDPSQLRFTDKEQKDFEERLAGENFGKLYGFMKEHVDSLKMPAERLPITRGEWRKFERGSNAKKLSDSLADFDTQWCIAGEGTAASYLSHSDVLVYYSEDADGANTIPRAAVVTDGSRITEVRGIMQNESTGAKQHLDSYIVPVVGEKLSELPGGDKWETGMADMRMLTEIEFKSMQGQSLSDEDLRFLYELDWRIANTGYGRDPRIDEIISQRAGVDSERLKPLLIESIKDQAEANYSAAVTMLKQLNAMRDAKEQITIPSQEQFNQLVTEKFNRWRANGTLDFIVERLETHRERFTLVSTPNIIASNQEIYALAKEFGKNQPAQAYIDQEFLDLYTPEELSGQIETNDQPLRLTLIPDRYTDELGYSDVEEQLRRLTSMRQDHPNLYMPSMLEAISYWQSLRAQGDSLDDSETWDLTYIRHFDLEEKSFEGYRVVPLSFFNLYGVPYLDHYDSADDVRARIAVR